MSNQINDGVRENAVPDSESERVVKAYAQVLELKIDAIVSDATLPFPKPIIKAALKAETLKAANTRFSTMAGACFRQIMQSTHFQDPYFIQSRIHLTKSVADKYRA